MQLSFWLWTTFNIFVLAMLALDLGIFHRKAHVVKPLEAFLWSIFWVFLALSFCIGIYYMQNEKSALEFLTGYVVEKSLSIDNIFVIVLIFKSFKTPPKFQHRVLFFGILGALVMRGLMILMGVQLIQQFHWTIYIFGAFLIYTGLQTFKNHLHGEEDISQNPILARIKEFLPVTDQLHGQKFFIKKQGKWWVTPLFITLLFIEFADLLFAIDSIPAILAISHDPFIVYTSNVFAILGLRSMYFLLADIVLRFYYLHHGLAAILTFVGIKMIMTDIYPIPVTFSLAIIGGIFLIAITASVLKETLGKKF